MAYLWPIRPGFVHVLRDPGYDADIFGDGLSASEYISYFDGDAFVYGGSLLVYVFISIYLRLIFVFKEMLFYYMV